MESSTVSAKFEPAWLTYTKSLLWLLPALLCWAFAAIFIIPKFQQIWADAGLVVSPMQWLMNALVFSTHHGGQFVSVLLLLLVLPEWFVRDWPRYRRAALGGGSFVTNTAVLLYLLGLCMAGAIAGPALMHPR